MRKKPFIEPARQLCWVEGTISKTDCNKQVLDKLQVERERGITVKAQSASLFYNHQGVNYLLNLIDTPGIQAQTVANFYLAFEAQLSIIPVINKIDLKHADPERVEKQIEKLFDIPTDECIRISAKQGTNVEKVLQKVIEKIPPPQCNTADPLKALVFDSTFDHYRGVIANVALFGGEIAKGNKIVSAHTKKRYEVNEVGILTPDEQPIHKLQAFDILIQLSNLFLGTALFESGREWGFILVIASAYFEGGKLKIHEYNSFQKLASHGSSGKKIRYAGQVGYVIAGMKEVTEAQIGDTLFLYKQPVEPLPGFKSAKPMVFAGMYPVDQTEYNNLKSALERLTLNDSSVTVHRDSSLALGAGWRLGFLGLLHMEVFNQRLEQEYNMSVILTAPTVPYKAVLSSAKLIKEHGKDEITIINPAQFPDKFSVSEYLEPTVLGTIVTPHEYIGKIIVLCQDRRAVQKDMLYIDENRVMLKYLFPLNEIVLDFYDALKTLSSGYASFDYEDAGYQAADLIKMDILLNGNPVEELSTIIHNDKAYATGKLLCERLKEAIPRQLFEIAIQAAIGKKIIARETMVETLQEE
ncbi:Translation factor GUF1, mitochondrial [Willisornis vidua]|uniref:Translation factor GUF1, mitochondrial n=1 Tax=Willisornis vidua TaxID=1566151 RepID=A0ABQ9D8U9_9PASS|nr:Translation factor GUF1, mitochondrial [Willisornis vidua]